MTAATERTRRRATRWREKPHPEQRSRNEPLVSRYEPDDDLLPCACSPGRPCLAHWARLSPVHRRTVAAQLGVRTDRESS